MSERMGPDYRAPPGTRIGHVHLRVADLNRSIAFYRDVLGFELQARIADEAAFLGASLPDSDRTVYHHHIGLNTWQSRGGYAPPPGHTGLYHMAIVYPDRRALAVAVERVMQAGIALTGATDHGISEAVYFDDPDHNGIELYRDRPIEQWPRDRSGRLVLALRRLDLSGLLGERAD